MITKWIKKLHMYLGLLNFTILVIFGIVGLSVSLLPPKEERLRPKSTVRHVSYETPGGLGDRELADHVYATLRLPLTQSAPDWSLRRDKQNNLQFSLGTPAKSYHIVVLEQQSQLRIESTPYDSWQYLFHLHEVTLRQTAPDWRMQAWGAYMELSIWSLIFMALSGVYLWLASRPGLRWAQCSLVAGMVSFIALWTLSR